MHGVNSHVTKSFQFQTANGKSRHGFYLKAYHIAKPPARKSTEATLFIFVSDSLFLCMSDTLFLYMSDSWLLAYFWYGINLIIFSQTKFSIRYENFVIVPDGPRPDV